MAALGIVRKNLLCSPALWSARRGVGPSGMQTRLRVVVSNSQQFDAELSIVAMGSDMLLGI